MFHRTTLVDVLEATVTVDEYGDDAEEWEVVAEAVGAHIAEKTRRAFSAVEARWTTTRELRVLLDAGTAVAKAQRLRQCDTGALYTVVHVYAHDQSPVGIVPTRADLEHVTG